jgi:hypothetical protein
MVSEIAPLVIVIRLEQIDYAGARRAGSRDPAAVDQGAGGQRLPKGRCLPSVIASRRRAGLVCST